MRSLKICANTAVVANATTNTTAVLLIAGFVGAAAGNDQAVPGEDMGFPSSGDAVLSVFLDAVDMNSTGSTINYQTSVNYYSQTVAGNSPTYVTQQVIFNGASGSASYTGPLYFDRVPLGEAVRISIVSDHTADAGKVTAYLLSN